MKGFLKFNRTRMQRLEERREAKKEERMEKEVTKEKGAAMSLAKWSLVMVNSVAILNRNLLWMAAMAKNPAIMRAMEMTEGMEGMRKTIMRAAETMMMTITQILLHLLYHLDQVH